MSKRLKSGASAAEIPLMPPIPLAPMASGSSSTESGKGKDPQASPFPKSDLPTTHDDHGHRAVPRHRFLSTAEWTIVANALGGVKDGEGHKPAHATHWLWPPLGMPPGLYRDVVSHKYRFYYLFHITSILRGGLMILQLFIGAALTALGAMSLEDGKPITVLAAVNTIVAGFLALLHNTGLPDRYRKDMAGFDEIEDHIKEILDSGIVPAGQAADQVLAECFDLYRDAKSVVTVNMPANYAPKQILSVSGHNIATASSGARPGPPAISNPDPSGSLLPKQPASGAKVAN